MIIKVIDDIPGAGKTEWAIQKINNDTSEEYNYIYITPFLSEVDRIQRSCNKQFYQPNSQLGYGSKLHDLHNLLLNGRNIVSTHSLFRMATEETRDLIKSNNYILILDEVMDVVEHLQITQSDLDTLIGYKLINVVDNMITWNEENEVAVNYDGRYNDIKNMAQNNCLFIINNKILIWTFPINIFKYFNEVYILTYLFEGQMQKYYYDLYNVQYEYYKVFKDKNRYYISQDEKDYTEIKKELLSKIHIIENKINNIGDDRYALSVGWFKKERNELLVQLLKKNLYNFFHNIYKCKSNQVIWTTFKDYKGKIQGSGFTRRFIPLNSRATNAYKECRYVAYCCNVFMNPIYINFFYQYNVKVNEDIYALSEMIQFIWRSAIREGKDIWIYIPSKRMRSLLIKWLEDTIK